MTAEMISSMYPFVLFGVWLITLVVMIAVTSLYKSKNTDWGNFWEVIIITAIMSGALIIFIISSPNQTSHVVDIIKQLFNFK